MIPKRVAFAAIGLCVMMAPRAVSAQASPPAYVVEQGADLPDAARAAARQIVAKGISGVTVVVAGKRGEISRVNVGNITGTSQLPIASASKWLTSAVVLQLVGEGKLSLDKPISTWLPDIAADAGTITLRQLLSQTSGLGLAGAEMRQDHRITLGQSAREVTDAPLVSRPGTTFVYGGPGFQVAGAVVEAVTGQHWEDVFQERIARPLGMDHTYWTHIGAPDTNPAPGAETRNPVLQGGAVSTVEDYMHFLSMVANNGRYNGRTVLTRDAVKMMLTDQTAAAVMTPTHVPLLDQAHYALGNWCEKWDKLGRCTRSSSLGAWGTYPWIDRPSGLYGIVFLYEKKDAFRILPEVEQILTAVISADSSLKRQ
jgi:CubicO group peptidase (beta-lactamase class C family)